MPIETALVLTLVAAVILGATVGFALGRGAGRHPVLWAVSAALIAAATFYLVAFLSFTMTGEVGS